MSARDPLGLDRGSTFVPGGILHGTIVETQGPLALLPPPNYWKWASVLLLIAGFLPLVAAVWLIVVVMRLALSMAGLGQGGGGLLGSIVFFHAVGTLFRPAVPVTVYHHVLRGNAGRILVRQEGEFSQGCIMPGNVVRLECGHSRGNLVVRSGYNETLSTPIATAGNPWKVLFFVALAGALLIYGTMLS